MSNQTPFDLFLLGYMDAHINCEVIGKLRAKYKTPQARTYCVGCMNSSISMDGLWYFRSCCVYCSTDGISRHVPCPLFLKPPSPMHVENPFYMYGYIKGVVVQSTVKLVLGGKLQC